MKTINIDQLKLEALFENHLGFSMGEDDYSFVGLMPDNTVENGEDTYKVLTEEEAFEEVKDYIKYSASYFNSDFLSDMTGLPEVVFESLEDENEAVMAIIEATCGLDEFTENAIEADGILHFLDSNGDSEEYSMRDENGDCHTIYIYIY